MDPAPRTVSNVTYPDVSCTVEESMTRLTWSMREEERSCCGRNASGSDVVANRLDER